MLQCNTIVCSTTTKFVCRLWWRLSIPLTTNATAVSTESIGKVNQTEKNVLDKENVNSEEYAEFKKLKTKLCSSLDTKPSIIFKIHNAKNIKDLVELTNTSLLSESEIKMIKNNITTWENETKVENDLNDTGNSSESYISTTTSETPNVSKTPNNDISRYYNLSTSAMIQEVYKLAQNRFRDLDALKYLFDNILNYNTKLHIKECSTLLFSMSALRYSDQRLLEKIFNDILHKDNIQSLSLVTLKSILKSMATIRYKDIKFLNKSLEQIMKHDIICDFEMMVDILYSLAILGYNSVHITNLIQTGLSHLEIKNLPYTSQLNLVWSLITLDAANIDYIQTVLNHTYVSRFLKEKPNLTLQLKLLNIIGYAKYVMNYSEPYFNDCFAVTRPYSNQKELYINTLETTLKNMVPSSSHYKIRVNTKMGFFLDAVLYLDANQQFLSITNNENCSKKIGIMLFDYHDLCINSLQPIGVNKLYLRLLASQNYHVIDIPYIQFGIEDKIEKRIRYLKRRLWE